MAGICFSFVSVHLRRLRARQNYKTHRWPKAPVFELCPIFVNTDDASDTDTVHFEFLCYVWPKAAASETQIFSVGSESCRIRPRHTRTLIRAIDGHKRPFVLETLHWAEALSRHRLTSAAFWQRLYQSHTPPKPATDHLVRFHGAMTRVHACSCVNVHSADRTVTAARWPHRPQPQGSSWRLHVSPAERTGRDLVRLQPLAVGGGCSQARLSRVRAFLRWVCPDTTACLPVSS